MKTIQLMIAGIVLLASCQPAEKEVKQEVASVEGCSYTRNETNAAGNMVRIVEDALFIALTMDDTTGGTVKTKDYMKGYLSCVSVDTVKGIYFYFKVYSADANRDYGMIKKDNKVSFILASGKTVTVPFAGTFSGNTNLSQEYTEYKTFSRISGADAELLKSSELQRVTISWTKIEEEYKVLNPSIFMKQLPCIQ